jgi:hypothetical protein
MRQIALSLFTYALLAAPVLMAQENAAYFELGGSAVIPSANYERRLNERWFGRVGLAVVVASTSEDTDTTVAIPLTASWVNRPGSNHHLELGGGVTIVGGDRQDLYDWGDDDDDQYSTAFLSGIAGYRYQKPDGGFLFRAVFTPVVGGGDFLPWAGISFGYAW